MKKSSVVDYRSVSTKNLTLSKKEGTDFTYQVLNNEHSLFVKTPKLTLSSGLMNDGEHTYVDFNLKGTLLESLVIQIDNKALEYLEGNAEAVLGKNYSRIILEENFIDSVRRGHTLRVRLAPVDELKVYDNQGFPVNLSEFPLEELLVKGDKVSAILSPRNVRFHKVKSKINWYLMVIKLNKSISDCPLDSDSEDDDNESEEENENEKNDSDLDIY